MLVVDARDPLNGVIEGVATDSLGLPVVHLGRLAVLGAACLLLAVEPPLLFKIYLAEDVERGHLSGLLDLDCSSSGSLCGTSSSISTLFFGVALGDRSTLTLPSRICFSLLGDELFVDFLQDDSYIFVSS